MLSPPDQIVLLACDNKSTVEVIQAQLFKELEPERVFSADTRNELAKICRREKPQIIVLGYDKLETSAEVYRYLAQEALPDLDSHRYHRVIALCNKTEAQRAYALCKEGTFDDYIVFWPLTYDPFRMMVSVLKAMKDLSLNQNISDSRQMIDRQQNDLEALSGEHQRLSVQGQGYSSSMIDQISALASRLEKTLSTFNETSVRLLQAVPAGANLEPEKRRLNSIAGNLKESLNHYDTVIEESHRYLELLQSNQPPRYGKDLKAGQEVTILVVDDDEFIRELVNTLLSPKNYDIMLSGNGQDAFKKIAEHKPDLILMDILMPGMDGILVTQLLKGDSALRHIPIIFLTGQNSRHTVDKCIDIGAADYIVKPFSRETLLYKVEMALMKEPLQRRNRR